MFGVLNIYKPKGMTSHDVIRILREKLKIKQIGHTGTLDPFAEGVLPIFTGKATRLIEYFDDDKEYLAAVQFGSATDTYDLEGKITAESNKKVNESEIIEALKSFKGEILQIPPIYSAIKVNGKKLYEYARNGEEVNIKPRKVTVFEIVLKSFDVERQVAEILIKCSKGTYIRSIANDLGVQLGCLGHLIKLVRTQAGKFRIENAILPDGENIRDTMKPPLEVLPLPKVKVSEEQHKKISHGMPIQYTVKEIKIGDLLILVYNDNIDAVGVFDGEKIKIKKVFI